VERHCFELDDDPMLQALWCPLDRIQMEVALLFTDS